jgi:N-acetylmuramoyl-L-alanine amidase
MKRKLSKREWYRRRRIKRIIKMVLTISLLLSILTYSILFICKMLYGYFVINEVRNKTISETLLGDTDVQVKYLTPNPYSRSQTVLKKIKGIVIHYTANPGTSAESNRSYFEGLSWKKSTSASSHYIIGLEGEVLQCIPLTEVSYASNDRNDDTIAIECCHMDVTGEFNQETYDSLVSLTAALCVEFELEEKDILRHYDVTGKLCPLYYVENDEAWENFKAEVMDEIKLIMSEI